MPVMRVHGADLYYTDTGGPGEPVMFLHGFLFDGRQFDAQVAALRDRYRCLALDFRGQGRSAVTRAGYQMEQHTADVLAVIRGLATGPVHLVGLSMGGFVAMRIAARQPELVRSLTLLNTSAAGHAPGKIGKHLVLTAVSQVTGVSPPLLADRIDAELYGEAFRTDPARAGERGTWRARRAQSDRSALARTLLGIAFRPGITAELGDIRVPALIIAGGADASLPPPQSRQIHALIAGSRLTELPGVGHSAPIEDPERVTRLMAEFLDGVQSGGDA